MHLLSFTIGLATALSVSARPTATAQHNQINLASQPKTTTSVTVKEGDTLSSIASTYQTTYVRLFDANANIQDPDVIYVGDSLRIPDPNEQLPDRELPADPAPVADQTPTTPSQTSQPAATAYVPPVVQSAPVAGCGDNSYANFIYSHESGCRTTAMSPNGCYGIGQACPASKIAYCGADYACQNAFFTAYAGKYGGWAGAYAFWVSHGWW